MPQATRPTAIERQAPRQAAVWAHRVLVLALGVALLLYGYCLLRTAWLCDDAYITFRTVGNFISGYGPTWNIAERVQAYTHPLWMLLLSGLFCVTADIYYSALFASIALSLAAVLIVAFGIARTLAQAILGLMILVFSKAFVDYSTSGLENPLSYLLLALFLRMYLPQEAMTPRRLLKLSLLAGLIVLNRMDLLLLVAPWPWPMPSGRPGRRFRAGRMPRPAAVKKTLSCGCAPSERWAWFCSVSFPSSPGRFSVSSTTASPSPTPPMPNSTPASPRGS